MSTPDELVQAQLAAQARDLSNAAPAAPAPVDLGAARPTVVDVEALAVQLAALQAKVQAAEEAANPPPAPPDNSLHVDSGAPGYLHAMVAKAEQRLAAIEAKLGL